MRVCKALLATSLLLFVTACSHVHVAGVAQTPNPPPPPGFAATCASRPLPFNAFITGCAPAARDQVTVVRAKG
jgi:hypothetical protein